MITTKNIITEYAKIDQSFLPEILKKNEFDFIKENIDLYGQDKDIDNYINAFVAKLNKYAGSKKEMPKQKSNPKKQGTTTKVVAEPKPKTKNKPKVKAKPKTKSKPKAKSTTKRKTVETAPDWLLVIRKFLRMKNKTVTQTSARRLLKEIQIKFAVSKNRKPTPYIELIRRIQNTIIDRANENLDKKSFELKVPAMFVSILKRASATVIVKKTKTTKVKAKALSGVKGKSLKELKAQLLFETKQSNVLRLKRNELTGEQKKAIQLLIDIADKEKDKLRKLIKEKEKLSGIKKKKQTLSPEKKLIEQMKAHAMPFRKLTFSRENFRSEFGSDGLVRTQIGTVSINQNQFVKIWKRKRERYFGLIKPTLESPQIIIRHQGKDIFIKTFVTPKREVFFTSLIKDDEGFVVVSNHEKREKQILKRIREGSITYRTGYLATALSGSRTPEPSKTTFIEFGLPLTITKVSKKKKPVKQASKSLAGLGIVPTTELQKMKFKTLPFTGPWLKLIGNPSIPFHLMFYGTGGSGKSTISIQLAHYLAEKFNFKVLYVAKEEGISQTAQEKFKRFNAYHHNIYISDGNNISNLKGFDAIVFDSVNELNLTPDNIRNIIKKNPQLCTIQIFKATKEGRFLGQSDYQHLVQAQFKCENGTCYPEKNRFGGNKTIKINFK